MNNSSTPSAVRRHEPHSVALQDMRPYALGMELLDDELLIVENLATLPADTQAVQTSFFTIGYCTAGSADCGGIRIEDDLLITADGCRFLGTERVPYHSDDVENFLAH